MMAAAIDVLYVDDEPDLLELGKLFLEKTGDFSIATIGSASAALELIKKEQFNAIISDYQMPDMDGIELLKKVRASGNTIPFILFTGRGREEVVIQSLNEGADFYLQKGTDIEAQFAELRHKIKKAVDHRRAEVELIALNRLYNTLSASNKAIVRIHEKKELLDEICRIIVNIGGFRMTWAGLVNPEKHFIKPVAAYSHIDGYLDTIAISTDDIPLGQGPTGSAYREKKYNVCNDIAGDPKIAPWREAAVKQGYRSLAAFPFALDTNNAGVITFYASEPNFFTAQIVELLKELADDISFALTTLDFNKSELKYRRLFETAQDAILILDGDTGEIIDANTFILDMLGYPFEYFIGKHLWELGFIRDKTIAQRAFTELKTNGYIRYEDLPLETQRGEIMNVEFISNEYLVDDKKIIQCNIRDITDRKNTETALRLVNKKLNLLSSITRHDINNQLLALDGFLELIHEKNPDSILEDYFSRITDASSRIATMIRFTKEYEEIGIEAPVWQDCRILVDTAVKEASLGQAIVHNNLLTGMEIFADSLISKVFYSLMENAVRYGSKITTVRFFSEECNGNEVIVCEDDGAGVPVEEKERIFERGFGKHTGLGLFLSREILSITGIMIKETGKPGKGARFEMEVPKGMWRMNSSSNQGLDGKV